MEHDGTHDPVRKLVLYGMAHADSPREVLPEGDHCKREAEPGQRRPSRTFHWTSGEVSPMVCGNGGNNLSVWSQRVLKSLLLRRKLDDPGAVFFVVRTPNSHLKLYLHSIVVAMRLEERIWTNGVASKIVFPPEISVTRAPVHDGTIASPASVFQLVILALAPCCMLSVSSTVREGPFWLDAILVRTRLCHS